MQAFRYERVKQVTGEEFEDKYLTTGVYKIGVSTANSLSLQIVSDEVYRDIEKKALEGANISSFTAEIIDSKANEEMPFNLEVIIYLTLYLST